MAARYILAVVGLVFLAAGLGSTARLGLAHPQSRTWLLVGAIMMVVSTWLFATG